MARLKDLRHATAILLLSGGIDSPVAGALLQQQGMKIIALHCSNALFTDKEPEQKSLELTKKLGFQAFYCAEASHVFALLSKSCQHKFYFVLSKRMMLRLAERLAHQIGAAAIITGENLAQVSSQTLSNLVVIQEATSLPLLRPLLAYDKLDIIKLAEELGTFDISKGKEHCDALGPTMPATKSSLRLIKEEEAKLDMETLLSTVKIERVS